MTASFAVLLSLTATARAEEAKKENEASAFMRVTRDKSKRITTLETSVVRYVADPKKHPGVTVDLVGAIHVGDRSYYDHLNKLFTEYDVVLYELVAPKDHKLPKGPSTHPVGVLQGFMKNTLKLEHQLAAIEYSKANFVHADFTPKEFAKSMKDRGESFLEMYFKIVGSSLAQQTSGKGTSDVAILAALFSKDRPTALKRAFAEQLVDSRGVMAVLDGPKGSTLLTERNKAALKVLDGQLAAGKKRIAIFYGAAHMPDFDRRLKADYGMRSDRTQWVSAWNLSKKQD